MTPNHSFSPATPIKAIILSAGQGRRLLPLTENMPKCLLPVADQPVLARQIDALLAVGINHITVITGFQVALIEALLQERYNDHPDIKALFNPFYEVADNLASCWIARDEMNDSFLLLNGDTVIESALLQKVLNSTPAAITLSVDYKDSYDADDMKVQLGTDDWVQQVSKIVPPQQVNAESIGLLYFREQGAQLFRQAVEEALRHPAELKSWYLSIIDRLAKQHLVHACSVSGFRWCEIDFIEDLARAGIIFGSCKHD
ncbi:phosphocholine cytidylyltransferase family protein [Nitrosomonas sp. JL21]|uniref:phosphocholine cytidylyltransferase family protein n=1 Tax=Nitrosomonas sp. JL21 TaxID=153949 RepID=UPI00136AA9E1|nr:phosphocholine cytidylyltransferase family protein [Nitrosomonas sp. JL21]MBL8497141.1 phosphocholine cytidylyltransferase family protein [Nitrosomonas sp.]MCC7091467.1 phosphocholine cytidylyltransferase family protein [Nitrosomonas sp.]MXS76611.1 phosphocholine cytidylyltransferase family protein [Nitrosomonas sp. JL21]